VRGLLAVLVLLPAVALPAPPASRAGEQPLLREEFASLDAWRPLTFPGVPRHSVYSIETGPDGTTSLRAESEAAASGIAWLRRYDVRQWPRLRWRWRVAGVLERGDGTTRGGDDYPVRVYVTFAYDPAGEGVARRMKYAVARARFGEYPPDSGISYVWANREHASPWVRSPYTDSVAVVFKEQGAARAGTWVEEEADVLADYRRIFGTDPPREASLAIMSDTDDTGGRATAWVDWIEIGR